ncbi:hypothetical protein ACWEIJ_42255 [Lentzea sp. NPDC004789]
MIGQAAIVESRRSARHAVRENGLVLAMIAQWRRTNRTKSAQLVALNVRIAPSVCLESRTQERPGWLRFTSTQLSPAGLQARARFHAFAVDMIHPLDRERTQSSQVVATAVNRIALLTPRAG